MKVHYEGEKGRALCAKDGLTEMTFAYRDVPFSDGVGLAKGILVGVCDKCGDVVAIPPQSTPAIKAARDGATVPVEAVLPAIYHEILNTASYRIDPTISLTRKDVHKHIIAFYLNRLARSEARAQRFKKRVIGKAKAERYPAYEKMMKKRLSMKVSKVTSSHIERLKEATQTSTTELLKSVIAEIHREIVLPSNPSGLKDLQAALAVANS